MFVRLHVSVYACVRPRTRACVSAHVRVFVHFHRIASPRACSTCERVFGVPALCAHSHRTGGDLRYFMLWVLLSLLVLLFFMLLS